MTQTAPPQGLRKFRYEKPSTHDSPRVTVPLGRSAVLRIDVQVVKEEGEAELEALPATESLWFVIGGRACFYGGDDSVLGEFGPGEGIAIPRARPHRFESASDEDLEILHITAVD